MRQWPDGKDVNTDAEESGMLVAFLKQRLAKTQQIEET
jgi:hypothetical protein